MLKTWSSLLISPFSQPWYPCCSHARILATLSQMNFNSSRVFLNAFQRCDGSFPRKKNLSCSKSSSSIYTNQLVAAFNVNIEIPYTKRWFIVKWKRTKLLYEMRQTIQSILGKFVTQAPMATDQTPSYSAGAREFTKWLPTKRLLRPWKSSSYRGIRMDLAPNLCQTIARFHASPIMWKYTSHKDVALNPDFVAKRTTFVVEHHPICLLNSDCMNFYTSKGDGLISTAD